MSALRERRERLAASAVLLAGIAAVVLQGNLAGVELQAIRPFTREAGPALFWAVALFGVAGFGPTRLLLPQEWRHRAWLFTLPIGAACATLLMTLLGLARVPLQASLAVTLAAGAAVGLLAVARQQRDAWAAPSRVTGLLVPLGIAACVGVVSMMPALRAGYPTVQGQNGDAILSVGTADFLQHAPPGAVRPELPLDQVPLLWRSKLPIYYGLAGVSELSGQDEIHAFSSVVGFVMGLFALGLFLFAVHALRAPPVIALLAALLVPLSRIIVHVSIHTYYNQLWATFALPFVLLFGWRLLQRPDARSAGLFGLFAALAIFTYPLLLPFPALFMAVLAWRRRSELRALSPRVPRWALLVAAVVAVPVVLVLARGVVEKVVPGTLALLPGGSLEGWGGGTALPYLPVPWFFGVESGATALDQAVAVLLVIALAALALRRTGGEIARALGIMLAGALLASLYVRMRVDGELFWFKAMSFAGPLVLMLAVVALGTARRGWPRIAAGLGLVWLALGVFEGARREIEVTYELGSRNVLEIRDWGAQIPTDRTIRIDVEQGSWQLWSWYLLPEHRVSASDPLAGFFPHPPVGFRGDFSLVRKPARPPDAIGPPVFENPAFALYRIEPNATPDTASRALVYDVTDVPLGL